MRDAVPRLDGPAGEVVLSRPGSRTAGDQLVPDTGRRHDRTAAGRGRRAPRRATTRARAVKGAVVLADGPPGAVSNPGGEIPGGRRRDLDPDRTPTRDRTRPPTSCSGATSRTTPDQPSFGFKASPRAARRPRERLAAGPVQVHVTTDTLFHRRPVRTLVAEIPRHQGPRADRPRRARAGAWRERQRQRLWHVAGARAGAAARSARGAAPPARTITFLWGDEIRASDGWTHADPAREVRTRCCRST